MIDPELRIVTRGLWHPAAAGWGQRAVGIDRSRLASIYSGQTGFDIYTRAISDALPRPLWGGDFYRQGHLRDRHALHAVLDRRFPRNNALLSHDLIEGSYARVGLTTDVSK